MSIVNQYRAIFKDSETNEVKSIFCNATSMIKAIDLLYSSEEKEPNSISLQIPNIITEPTSETFVNLSCECRDEDGELLVASKCYPSSLENVKRGDTIYLSAVAEEEYEFVKWTKGDVEYLDNPLRIIIPIDESISSVLYTAVFKKTE